MKTINVNDEKLPADVRRVLKGLEKLGFCKAGEPYNATYDILKTVGIDAPEIKPMVTTPLYRFEASAFRSAGVDGKFAVFTLNYNLINT